MKNLTIGRDDDCDIIVNDPKGLVSRRHAILKENAFGNYVIIDVSKNGTFVNGVRIKPHTPCKVSRRDVVVFSNSAKLDWAEVSDGFKYIKACIIGLVCILILSLVFVLATRYFQKDSNINDSSTRSESIRNDVPESPEAEPKDRTFDAPVTDNSMGTAPVIPEDQPRRRYKEEKRAKDNDPKSEQKQEKEQEPVEDSGPTETASDKNPGGD